MQNGGMAEGLVALRGLCLQELHGGGALFRELVGSPGRRGIGAPSKLTWSYGEGRQKWSQGQEGMGEQICSPSPGSHESSNTPRGGGLFPPGCFFQAPFFSPGPAVQDQVLGVTWGGRCCLLAPSCGPRTLCVCDQKRIQTVGLWRYQAVFVNWCKSLLCP